MARVLASGHEPAERTLPRLLLAAYLLLWGWLAIAPIDRQDWFLENLLAVTLVAILVLTHRRFRFSNLSYVLIALFMALHAIGAHYTYAKVPAGFWLQETLGLSRNPFDRIVQSWDTASKGGELNDYSVCTTWGWKEKKFDGNVTEVVYTPITNDATRLSALVAGNVDLINDPAPQDVPKLAQTPGGWRVVESAPETGARAALAQFLDAADAGRWDAVWAALHPELQARYTPERLAQDFGREPQAPERLARARAALAGPVRWADGQAHLPVGAGRAVRLARVEGSWRVVALE